MHSRLELEDAAQQRPVGDSSLNAADGREKVKPTLVYHSSSPLQNQFGVGGSSARGGIDFLGAECRI